MSRLKIIDVPEDTQLYQDALTGFLFSMPEKTASDDISVISASKITDCHTYAIIDALKKPDIAVLLDAYETEWSCLWKGELGEQFSLYAPYIVRLEKDKPFTEWLIRSSRGNGWGIFIRSYLSLNELTHHLRKFNQLYDEVNKMWVMFRYYAPETVREFIPFLPADDFAEFTTGLTNIICENPKEKNSLVFI